jgi:hypothetical protein
METRSVGLGFASAGVTDIRFGDIESDEFSARARVSMRANRDVTSRDDLQKPLGLSRS